jgi:hypothetical protein
MKILMQQVSLNFELLSKTIQVSKYSNSHMIIKFKNTKTKTINLDINGKNLNVECGLTF